MSEFEEELSNLPVSIITNYGDYWNKAQLLTVFKDWRSPEYIEKEVQAKREKLPVVPEYVAEFIEDCKKEGDCLFGIFADAKRFEHDMPDLVYFWLDDEGNNNELFARAWFNGYQVEKPQLFYLKNKMTKAFLYDNGVEFGECDESCTDWEIFKTKFTKQEIDSMETGSYEQIEVEE